MGKCKKERRPNERIHGDERIKMYDIKGGGGVEGGWGDKFECMRGQELAKKKRDEQDTERDRESMNNSKRSF